MFRYADPHLCPGCRTHIGSGTTSCPDCRVPLTGDTAERLFRTLGHADALLAVLAASTPATTVPATVPAALSTPRNTSYDDRTPPPYPAPARPATPPRGLSATSVPRILLGLGATCLLVAAIVFLAVAWAALGVGGRTTVLVLLTAGAAVTAGWLARRGLRAGTESFATVALGLLALDLVGAQNAGWLGPVTHEWFLVMVGFALSAAGFAVAVLARLTDIRELTSGQVFAVIGTVVTGVGITSLRGVDGDVRLLVATLLTGAAAAVAVRLGLAWSAYGTGAVAGLWWLMLAGAGVSAGEPATVAHVWGELAIWPALAAAAVAAAVAVVRPLPLVGRVVSGSLAALLGVYAATVVAWDESGTVLSLVQLAVVAGCAVAGLLLAAPWRWVTVPPALVAGLLLGYTAARLAGTAVEALLAYGVWTVSPGVSLTDPGLPWSWPVLLPAGTAGAVTAAWLLLRCVDDRLARMVGAPAITLVVVTAPLVPALYGVPLWVALGCQLFAALGLLGFGAFTGRVEPALGSAVLAPLVLGTGLASDWLTAGVLAVVTSLAGWAAWRGSVEVRAAGDVVLPLSTTGLLWSVLHLADVDDVWRGVVVLVALGALAISRPELQRELPAAVAGAVVLGASVTGPAGVDQAWLAVLLTLSGVLVSLSALAHPHRRRLGWAATGLFGLAQWVRLDQLGVTTVEAYTLPLACVLLIVGAVRLLRDDVTSHRALGPGLGLALVPTLLQVLVDPLSPRAVLLGLGCLVLVAVGVAQRWSAPLLAGASVGCLVVLREAAHAEVLPQWVVIGLVGAVLTAVGVTWERRLAELRLAGAYLRRLR